MVRRGGQGRPGYYKPPLPWHPLPMMDEYLDYLTSVAGRAESTLRTSRYALTHFSRFCIQNDIKGYADVGQNDAIRFRDWLSRQPLSPRYQRELFSRVRVWFTWLADEGYLDETPFEDVRLPSRDETRPEPLRQADLDALFAAHRQEALQMTPFRFHRREALMALMLTLALHPAELRMLDVHDADPRLKTIAIRRGGDIVKLPYGPQLQAVVMRWLRARARFSKPDEHALFITADGVRISPTTIKDDIHHLARRAGVDISTDQLRMTGTVALLKRRVKPRTVQRAMGYKTRQTVDYYQEKLTTEAYEAHEKTVGPLLDRLVLGKTADLEDDR